MDDVQKLLEYIIQNLSDQLSTNVLPDEYYYQSLTLAAIDAVYSARARYPSVQSVVERYCNKYKLARYRSPRDCLPQPEGQENVNALIQKMVKDGCLNFAEKIFENQSRTAGRLKADVLLDLLNEIQHLNIQTFQDIQPWLTQYDQQCQLVSTITKIHGIGEATSRYFLMLAGDEQMVKPDRMILRFIRNALGRTVNEVYAVSLIQALSKKLVTNYPHMSPRLLDYLIWTWQRNQPKPVTCISTNQEKDKPHKNNPNQNINIQPSSNSGSMTIPQKTQKAMHKRYQPGALLTSTQIKNDVLADYPGTPRGSVMPKDYCCNEWNRDPSSGIHHIFFYEKTGNNYRLLPPMDITKPRKRGVCN